MTRPLALVLLFAAPVFAQTPPLLLHVQGRVLDGADLPVEGSATVKFRFYPSDGSTAQPLWTATYSVNMVKGVSDVNLGDPQENPLPATLLTQAELWMSVQVNDDAEMAPRLRVGSTVYSLHAGNAAKLGGVAAADYALAAEAAMLDGATFSGPVTLAGAPTANSHAATKKYVDDTVAAATPTGYAQLSGATFAGPVTLAADPSTALGAATRQYVDAVRTYAEGVSANAASTYATQSALGGYAPLSGAVFTTPITVGAPTAAGHAATRGYVDGAVAALPPSYSVEKAQVAAGTNLVAHWQMENSNGWLDAAETVVDTFLDGREARVHRSTEGGTDCYNWAISNKFPVDPNRSYEFSIWIRSSEADMDNYFGFYAYDASGNQIAGAWGNPYFKVGQSDPNTWRLGRAYMLPSYVTDANNDGVADKAPIETNGTDWRWPPGTATAVARFGACYGDGSNTGQSFFAFPSAIESGGAPTRAPRVYRSQAAAAGKGCDVALPGALSFEARAGEQATLLYSCSGRPDANRHTYMSL